MIAVAVDAPELLQHIGAMDRHHEHRETDNADTISSLHGQWVAMVKSMWTHSSNSEMEVVHGSLSMHVLTVWMHFSRENAWRIFSITVIFVLTSAKIKPDVRIFTFSFSYFGK